MKEKVEGVMIFLFLVSWVHGLARGQSLRLDKWNFPRACTIGNKAGGIRLRFDWDCGAIWIGSTILDTATQKEFEIVLGWLQSDERPCQRTRSGDLRWSVSRQTIKGPVRNVGLTDRIFSSPSKRCVLHPNHTSNIVCVKKPRPNNGLGWSRP